MANDTNDAAILPTLPLAPRHLFAQPGMDPDLRDRLQSILMKRRRPDKPLTSPVLYVCMESANEPEWSPMLVHEPRVEHRVEGDTLVHVLRDHRVFRCAPPDGGGTVVVEDGRAEEAAVLDAEVESRLLAMLVQEIDAAATSVMAVRDEIAEARRRLRADLEQQPEAVK